MIALTWPNHVHHTVAVRWFADHREQGWATCPATEAGFVRVSSNQSAIPEAKSPADAIEVLRQLTGLAAHTFWHDDIALSRSQNIQPSRIIGYRQVTDAHLVALAIRHGGRLATFDRGTRDVVPSHAKPEDVLELLG